MFLILIAGAADVVENGVSAEIALDSASVASNGWYLCSQFLNLYVILISSGIMHAFSIFPMMSLFCVDVRCFMYFLPDLCYYGCPFLFHIDRNFNQVIPFWASIPIHVRLFQPGCH